MSESGQTNPTGQDPRISTAVLPMKAHHPKSFKFPKRSFGKKMMVI